MIVDLGNLGDHPIFSPGFGFAEEMSSFWRKTHTHVDFEAFYGGQFALSTHLIVPNYLVIPSPTQHQSVLRNLTPFIRLAKERLIIIRRTDATPA